MERTKKHFNVKSNGILTVKAGYVYYENSGSDYQQIVMTDEDGNLQPVLLSTTKDFTEITKAQKLKTDFVANVSHELRTPLVSIKGSLETILGPASKDQEAQKKFMSIMSDQVLRMENLINDLLILSRIELEEHIKPNKIVSLNDLFTNIKSNFELILKKKKINLHIELMEPTLVFGDNDKLLTVFSNLIDNSIKIQSIQGHWSQYRRH